MRHLLLRWLSERSFSTAAAARAIARASRTEEAGLVGGGADAGADVLTGPPGALAAWTESAGRKVQPTTAPTSSNTIAVSTVRDAYVGAQLVVQGAGGYLQAVTASVIADLTDGAGHTLAKSEISLFRESFIDFAGVTAAAGNQPVPASSPTMDTRVADPLIPLVDPYSGQNAGQPFDVGNGVNQPLFVDVHVPKGLAAGTYTGTIHVAAMVGGSADVPIAVTVWNLDLPDMRSVTTHFKLSIDNLYYYHSGTSACSGGNCYLDTNNPETQTLIQRYEDLAHAHRIDIGQAMVQLPVNGCNAPATSDWMAYDTAMAPYMSGTYFTDGVPSGRFDTPFSPGQNAQNNPSALESMCSQAQYEALAQAWASHLMSQGWFPQPSSGGFGAVVYAFDEPLAAGGDVQGILNGIVQNSQWLQAAVPGSPSPWKAHVIDTVSPIAAPANPATTPLLDPALGAYVVNLPEYGAMWQPWYGRTEWQQNPGLLKEGLALWFYESNSVDPPDPTFATNTLDGNEPVVMMWGSWYELATGFLYWDIAAWDEMNPWGPEISFGKTGDGVLIYPGDHSGTIAPAGSPSDVAIDGPVPSYRLKMIRQGLQDWALFRYADTKGLTSYVQQQVGMVYTQFGGTDPHPSTPYWTTDPTTMDAIRSAVVSKIVGP